MTWSPFENVSGWVDDLIVLSEIAADRGGMDLEQAGRPRTRSLTLVNVRHFCLRIALS